MISPIYNLSQLEFVAGESQTFYFNLLTKSGGIYDASGCDVNFAVINYTNKIGSPLLVKKARILIGKSGISNVAQIDLIPEDTLDYYGKYVYQISIRDTSGKVVLPGLGIMNITKNIDQAFITG